MTIFAVAVRETRQGEIVETNVASHRLCESVGFRAEGLYRDGYRDDAGGFHNLAPYGMLAMDR